MQESNGVRGLSIPGLQGLRIIRHGHPEVEGEYLLQGSDLIPFGAHTTHDWEHFCGFVVALEDGFTVYNDSSYGSSAARVSVTEQIDECLAIRVTTAHQLQMITHYVKLYGAELLVDRSAVKSA